MVVALAGALALASACSPERLPSSPGPSLGAIPPRNSPFSESLEAGHSVDAQGADAGGDAGGTDAFRPAQAAAVAPQSDAGCASRERADPSRIGEECTDPAGECLEGKMLYVPEGPFTMGNDQGGEQDERPAHRVTVAAFWLDRTEVSNRAYERCVSAGVCRPHDLSSARKNRLGEDVDFRGGAQPISSVSWDDAKAYCQFAGKRLPREAEWEKAARGTDARRFPWGDARPTPQLAVFETGRTANVGSHPQGAGPYGHLDLAGNVWEWIDDIYDPYAYRRAGAPQGIPGSCQEVLAAQKELKAGGRQGFTGSNPIPDECEHVLRGGAFNYGGGGLRASNRVHHPGRFRLIMSGFRCAKDASVEPIDAGCSTPQSPASP